jgi:hypothetical protein
VRADSYSHWRPLKQYRIYGSDGSSRQFLFSWAPSRSYAIVPGSLLNEDDSLFNRGDEIYAQCIYYHDPGQIYIAYSNLVEGNF